jgi:hypothetical protein
MSLDEIWLALGSTAVAVWFWGSWFWATLPPWPPRWRPTNRGPLWIAPALSVVLLWTVLTTVASRDVVNDGRYIYMYLALGLAWVGLAAKSFPASGLMLRDDAIERRNPAVAPALGGAVLGVTAAYAGGNIGDGPGWWVVVVSAFLATGALLLAWQALDAATGIGDRISIERDTAAGWRLGGFLLAGGAILGRAVAGDWVSLDATIGDALRTGWPVLPLLGLGILFERTLLGNATEPHPPVIGNGVFPAIGMVALAAVWLSWLGLPG